MLLRQSKRLAAGGSRNSESGKGRSELNRRRFLAGAGAVVGASSITGPLLLFPGKAKASEQIVITLWGGQQAEYFQEAYLKPFTKETGIPVIDAGAPEMAKVKAMVRTGDIEWDVVLPDATGLTSGEKDGLWEPIDYSTIDMTDAIGGIKRDHGMCYEMIAGGVCWNEQRNDSADKHPEDWRGFFDPTRFPGRRGLRNRAPEMLEIALLGDGVPPAKLYPLDVDRAFKVLERLKPSVSNWIAATPQTITLVQQNECDFTYAYNGRVYAAQKSGIPIQMSHHSNIVYVDYMAVVKGSKNRDAAMRLFSFIMRPDRQAAFANLMPYGPVNSKAINMTNQDVRQWFADPNAPNSLLMNVDYWADHATELNTRFKEWLLT